MDKTPSDNQADDPPGMDPSGDLENTIKSDSPSLGADSNNGDDHTGDDMSITRPSFWNHPQMEQVDDFNDHPKERYTLLDEIGSGGNAKVFLGFDCHLDRTVAIKVQNKINTSQKKDLQSFLQEASTSASLDHPNIVPVYDLDLTSEGRLFLAMKNIEGRSLADLVKDGANGNGRSDKLASPNAVASILLKVCDAVAYAHSKGLIHQDIKPGNIMIGDFGEVLLIDWGIASVSENPGFRGTPAYMSPEQARQENPDPRSDVYSLGATLFNVLTSRYPLQKRDAKTFWIKKRQGEIDPPTQKEKEAFSPALMAIATHAMHKDISLRYQNVQALANDLQRLINNETVSVFKESSFTRFVRYCQNHAAICKSVVISASILFLLSGTYLYHLNQKNDALRDGQLTELRLELAKQKLEEERRHHWIPLSSHDFRSGKPLDPRIEAIGEFDPQQGPPNLAFLSPLRTLQWFSPIPSAPRIEIEFLCDGRPSLSLHIFDRESGFNRVLNLDEKILFSKYNDRYSAFARLYSKSLPPSLLHQNQTPNQLSFWLDGSKWFAELNGIRIFEYYDSYPNVRAKATKFIISRNQPVSDLQLLSLKVFRRESPTYVSILEPGRAFNRFGLHRAAHEWFKQVQRSAPSLEVAAEADYLRASIDFGQGPDERIDDLGKIAEKKEHLFRNLARQSRVDSLIDTGRWKLALDECLKLQSLAPELNTLSLKWRSLAVKIQTLSEEEKIRLLQRILELDPHNLNASDIGIKDLSFLKGSQLSFLNILNNPVEDLSPLKGVPLEILHCTHTNIDDISVLENAPLKTFIANRTKLRDISPLKGKFLDKLILRHCPELDSSTLKGIRSIYLSMDRTPIFDPSIITGTDAKILRMAKCDLPNLDFIKGMTLSKLNVNNNNLSDISGLAGQEMLELSLENCQIVDLTPLAQTRIQIYLILKNNPIVDLSPLNGQPLRKLVLSHTSASDLSPLTTLPNLETLNLRGLRPNRIGVKNGETGISYQGLESLSGLKVVDLDLAENQIQDLTPLKDCHISGQLNLSNNPVKDLSALTHLNLTSLTLSGCPIEDFSPLKGLEFLSGLELGQHKNTSSSLSPLRHLNGFPILNLDSLSLAGNDLTDIKVLGACQIKSLNLSGNPISDISPLSGQPLRHLDLSNTKVSSYEPLLSLGDLTTLNLHGLSLEPKDWRVLNQLQGVFIFHDEM